MRYFSIAIACCTLWLAAAVGAASAQTLGTMEDNTRTLSEYDEYRDAIDATARMVLDGRVQDLARQRGLDVLNVTWEDTGRYLNSAVGPNISDMTLQVQHFDPRTETDRLSLMPVIRRPNFTDETADVEIDRFFLLVGNERGETLQRVSLRQFLGDLRRYLNEPDSWEGDETSLLADRDTHVLVSAQACFLPVPRQGIAEFNPVLFNYQSYAGDPAVLTILATREGTSVTIIDNLRDAFDIGQTWGQRLFFNQNGDRASLTGQRLSDFSGDATATPEAGNETGLNMVMLIQVPLKQRQPLAEDEMMLPSAPGATRGGGSSDMETAVIGHGEIEGPFTEIDGLPIERDPRFPIRVTVQFYQATSNGIVSEADMDAIATQIDRVYRDADYVGSLVVDGATGRPTEHTGPMAEPPGWWDGFWQRYEQNTGRSRQEAIEMLYRLRGEELVELEEGELHDLLQQAR